MSTSDSKSANYVLLTRLADEFAARHRAGERPPLQEYINRHPELADDIRELFPAMVEIEQVKEDHQEAAEQAVVPPAPAIQQLGDFRIIREIGKGGMGIVYEAEQVSLGRHVALKVLPRSMLVDAKAKRRFEREAKSAAKLHHTNIVPVFGVGEQDGLPYYVMQFIQGLGLDEVLLELKKLQLGNVKTGPFGGGELRISHPVGQVANLPEEKRQVGNLPHGAPSAVQVARSLLTGEFQGTNVQNSEEAAPATIDGAHKEDQGADAPRFPVLSDEFTPSSSSIVLPGRSRDGSKSKNKKQTYWQCVASIGMQVAEALEYAHKQGIHHRDIKPSNLLLDTQGTVWVTDFGLAKADDRQNLTQTGDILGTLRYMPPEAFEGKTDARSDVYSLGLTLYEMLACRPAFDEQERNRLIKQVMQEEPARLGKLNRQVPKDLETIVHKAIDKAVKQRYASAGALAEDLQRYIEDEPIKARRVSQTERCWRWCKRNPVMAGLAAAVFVLLAAVAVVASVGYVQTRLALSREATEHAKADRQRVEAERERRRAETNLYHSLVREAEAIRRVRDNGYRDQVWNRLKQALALETPDKDPARLRQEAVACMGDFLGHNPTDLTSFTSEVRAMEVRPKCRQVMIGLEDGTLLLRDFTTGDEIARLQRHPASPVVSLSFAAHGNRMASVDVVGMVKLWQANTDGGWVCTRTIGPIVPKGSDNPSILLALTSDGKSLVTYASPQPKVALWNCADGIPTTTFALPGPGTLTGLALSPHGKFLAAGYTNTQEHRLLVWEVSQHRLAYDIPSDLGEISSLVFGSNGQYLAYGGNHGGAVLAAPKFDRLFLTRVHAATVDLGPDDKLMAFTDYDFGAIRLWDIARNREVGVLRFPGPRFVRFSKDGQALLAIAWSGEVRIWDLTAAREKLDLRAHVVGVPSVAFSPDGKRLASAGKDRTVRIWDPATGGQVHTLSGFRGEVETVAFSPDSSILATGDYFGDVRLWQLPAGQELLPALQHTLGRRIEACAFSSDGRFFAACGERGIIIWKFMRPAGGRRGARPWLQQLAQPSDRPIGFLSFSPDGNVLAWTTPVLHLWDVSNSRRYPFPPFLVGGNVRNTMFSRDSKHLAFIASGLPVPEVWDVVTRQRVCPSDPNDFRGARERGVGCMALSADDAWLANGGARGSVTVWDLQKRELLLALPEERGSVWGLAWSPKRELLAASFSDGSVALWNIPLIRTELAKIGLDWQDLPLPAALPEQAEAVNGAAPVETARLFGLHLWATAEGTLAVEGNSCRVDVTSADGTDWHVTVAQVFVKCREGATYRVQFKAKADAARRIGLVGIIEGPDWHSIGLEQLVHLTEDWQPYEYEFQAKRLAPENDILFHVGERTGTVWIADFTVTELAK